MRALIDYFKNKRILHIICFVLSAMGAICLVAALVLLTVHIKRDKQKHHDYGNTKINHKILFLSSYDSLYYTYDDQIVGLKEAFLNKSIEFDSSYMDAKRFRDEEDFNDFYQFFKKRYNNNAAGYEAILLGDDDALEFALEHKSELFDKMPMVFIGINNLKLAIEADKDPYITGFYENDYFDETLLTALETFPDKKYLVALHDGSTTGYVDMDKFYSFKEIYLNHTFSDIDISTYTEEGFIRELRKLPEDSIIFFMTCYEDMTGERHSIYDITSYLIDNTDAPIFRSYAGGREYGILGGTYMDFVAQSKNAGNIISEILIDGSDVSKYKLNLKTPGISLYNYPVMQRYGISEKQLPPDTVYVDRPIAFWEYYKDILPVVILMMESMIFFILTMTVALINEKNHVKALKISKKEIEESRSKLKYQAEHDELIGLLNRRTMVDYLDKSLSITDIYSMIVIDIDGFKDINENYGHDIGDVILKQVGAALAAYAIKHDLKVGRYGGDEFIMLCPGKLLDEKSPIILGISELFKRSYGKDNVKLVLSASLGISNSDGEAYPEQHIINAEIAMYEAKSRGKNMAFVYAEEMKNKLTEESLIKAAFIDAFENDGFYLKYQPKISTKTKDITGYEALVRLKNSQFGPAQFIPIIEKTGWTTRLGRLITELAVRQLYEWQKSGKKIYPVSINFSSRQINDTEYFQFLSDLLKKYNVDPKYIEIEITESLLLEETELTAELFMKLKQLGIRLLLDDFGTGYSSLAYLTYVPVDDVKLDKSLVDTYLCEGKEDFIRDVILLDHDMGKSITIEGVEHGWQFEKLAEFNADTIQGYYFSKPLNPDDAIDFIVTK